MSDAKRFFAVDAGSESVPLCWSSDDQRATTRVKSKRKDGSDEKKAIRYNGGDEVEEFEE